VEIVWQKLFFLSLGSLTELNLLVSKHKPSIAKQKPSIAQQKTSIAKHKPSIP